MTTQKAFAAGSEFPPLKADTLRLYSMRMCPYAQRAIIVLAYKNIPYETVNINLSQKPAWYLDKNPLGLVPSVEKNDTIVYESLVVCEYLDEVYPENKIVPTDPYHKAKDRMFIERFSKIVAKYYGFLFEKDEKVREEIAKDIVAGYGVMEAELQQRRSKFFGGEEPMLIDFAIWPHMERLLLTGRTFCPALSVSKETFPHVAAWASHVTSVPAVRDSMCAAETLMAFYSSYKEGSTPDYDIGLEEKQAI